MSSTMTTTTTRTMVESKMASSLTQTAPINIQREIFLRFHDSLAYSDTDGHETLLRMLSEKYDMQPENLEPELSGKVPARPTAASVAQEVAAAEKLIKMRNPGSWVLHHSPLMGTSAAYD